MKTLIDKLERNQILAPEEFKQLLENQSPELFEYLFAKARAIQGANYGKDVYIRGLIEFTNHCKNDCHYCGIRNSNRNARRYRLDKEQILECCQAGYELGFRTFVLQGGEDPFYTDETMVAIVKAIREGFPDCAITLSLGERTKASYQALYDAGANRYLLRHESANANHYAALHPEAMTLATRKQCLYDLKDIGYQVGCGFMVGSPNQTIENLVEDLLFIKELGPHMVGIGPFIPHHDTPFASQAPGTLEQTLFLLGIIRLMLPEVLLPATTALGTISPKGRELGILAGANVVMPNLSPGSVRKDYMLYDNKICTGDEAAECRSCMEMRLRGIGYQVAVARGDHKSINDKPTEGEE